MLRNIDPDLTHHRYRLRPDVSRRHSRTRDFKALAREVSQQPFRHLAARRVSGAEYQDMFAITHV
jgi:hypothetical protein